MKKITKFKSFILLGLFIFLSSCETTELEGLLDNPNGVSPDKIDLNFGTDGVQLSLRNFFIGSEGVGSQAMRMYHVFGNTWQNNFAPGTGGGAWNNAYANILKDSQILIQKAQDFNAPYNEGILRLSNAYALMTLVDYWGDVPYTEALEGSANFNPSADSGQSVYEVALQQIDLGLTKIQEAIDSDFANNIPGGGNPNNFFTRVPETTPQDVAQATVAANWIKFGNSLKFKYYLNTGNVTELNNLIAADNLIDSTEESFVFSYFNDNDPESRHPFYVRDYGGTGNPAVYMSNSFMFDMVSTTNQGGNAYEDPRTPYYFFRQTRSFPSSTDNPSIGDALPCFDDASPFPSTQAFCRFGAGYWGRDHGNNGGIPPDGDLRTVFGSYPIGGRNDNDGPRNIREGDGLDGEGVAPILMSFQMNLMRAEAALTLGTNDNAAALLNTAMQQSIEFVTSFGTDSVSGTTYRGSIINDFNNADNNGKLNIIAQQMRIASFGSGTESYNMYRRTGKPDNMQLLITLDGAGAFPRSLFYPTNTANLNTSISQKANLEQSVFWANPGIQLQ